MEDMWTVTRLEPFRKSKYKVYLNDELAFVLYRSDLNKLKIEEGTVLSEEQYSVILNDILNKRAIKRAMYLLQSMERTEYQLREKLHENFYPEESIDAAVAYVESYHYVDDADYALRYVDAKSRSKSLRQIGQELTKKGVSRETIERAVQEAECDDRELIRRIISKKAESMDLQEQRQRQKLIRHLLYKGFEWEDVRYEMERLT